MTRFLLPFILSPLISSYIEAQSPGSVAGLAVGGKYFLDTLISARDVEEPLSLAFAREDRGVFFFTERGSGRIRIVERGRLNAEPFVSLRVSRSEERGAVAVAVHPLYPDSPFIYGLYNRLGDRANVVVRFVDSSSIGVSPTVIATLPRLGSKSFHRGGSLGVGPDGTLMCSIAEYEADTVNAAHSMRSSLLFLSGGDEGWTQEVRHSSGTGDITLDESGAVAFLAGDGVRSVRRVDGTWEEVPIPFSAESLDSIAAHRERSQRRDSGPLAFDCMHLYTGDAFPHLQGKLLAASRHHSEIWVLTLSMERDSIVAATAGEFLPFASGYRDIASSADGGVYVITAHGSIVRLQPISPKFISKPPVHATQDVAYVYRTHIDGTPSVLSLLAGPEGALLDEWGTVRWLPSNEDALAGSATIILRAVNGAGADVQRTEVFVENVNDPPREFQLSFPPADTSFSFIGMHPVVHFRWLEVVDPDGDSVNYQLQIDTLATFLRPVVEMDAGRETGADTRLPATSGEYHWRVRVSDGKATALSHQTRRVGIVYTENAGTFDQPAEEPLASALEQNFPNPFNPTTSIKYTLPKSGHVHLGVFNMLGQEVAVIFDGQQNSGVHELEFKNIDLPSGIYFYRIQAPDFIETRKMVIAK